MMPFSWLAARTPHRLARNEEEAQIARLKYVLGNGVKEGLVEKVSQWPGVHCVRALVEGETVEGYWFDRSQEYAARQRGQDFDRLTYATPEVLNALGPSSGPALRFHLVLADFLHVP